MADTTTQENQQELFGSFSDNAKRVERIPAISGSQKPMLISTTLEHVLLVSIVSILILCFVFFLGVLRGQSISTNERLSPIAVALRPAPTLASAPAHKLPVLTSRVVETNPIEISKKVNSNPITSKEVAKPYTIQLLTTKKKLYAEREVDSLRKAGYYTMIIPSGGYYQVCVGFYANKSEAKKDILAFSSKYKGCYLRRR